MNLSNNAAQSSYPKNVSFEQVWATLDRVAEMQEKTVQRQEEIDRILKENAVRQEKNDRQIEEYNKRFGDFTNRFGDIVEYMLAPNMRDKFKELGLYFPKANRNSDVSDYDNKIFLEIDVMLENGGKAMLVEIKTKLTNDHVNDHIERLEKMRKYADLHGDNRKFLGALAGVIVPENVKDYALSLGFFLIEPTGENLNITSPYNKPKEW